MGNPEYVGFTHYRRFFQFNSALVPPLKRWLRGSRVFCKPTLFNLSEYIDTAHAMEYFVEGYQCITTARYDARLNGSNSKNCQQRFYEIANFDPELYQRMEKIVLERHPDYRFEIEKLREKPEHYLFNMFVMPRRLFFKYCEFIFPILFQLDNSNFVVSSPLLKRGPGFLSEFLTSMFISHEIRVNALPVKELDVLYIENPLSFEIEQSEGGCVGSHADEIKIRRYDKLASIARKLLPSSRARELVKKYLFSL